MRNGMATHVLVGLAVCLGLVLTGCKVPHVVGLQSSLSGNGTTSETTVEIDALPDELTLSAACSLTDGTLRMVVIDPSGATAFDRTFRAGQTTEVRESLDPMLGRWRMSVSSPGAVGSYEVWVSHDTRVSLYY